MAEYSALSLLRNALSGNRDWKPAWRKPTPEARLRRDHHRRRRPRPVDRLLPRQGARHQQRRRGGEGLARLRQCRPQHDDRALQLPAAATRSASTSIRCGCGRTSPTTSTTTSCSRSAASSTSRTRRRRPTTTCRRGNAMRHGGGDAVWLTPEEIGRKVRGLDVSGSARFPVVGGLLQPKAGTARHDAVAWGYARGADRRGVDIRRELRGHRLPARWRPHRRRDDDARRDQGEEGGGGGRRQHRPRHEDGRHRHGCRSRAMCCRPSFRNR